MAVSRGTLAGCQGRWKSWGYFDVASYEGCNSRFLGFLAQQAASQFDLAVATIHSNSKHAAEHAANHYTNGPMACAARLSGSSEERRLKDEFGGRHVRVRGDAKVLCHLMFGIIALTVDQLMRLTL